MSKINFETKYRINQTVWVVEPEKWFRGDFEINKYTIKGFAYYGKDNIEYIMNEVTDTTYKEEELYDRYKKACDGLDKALFNKLNEKLEDLRELNK